jgi:hypothetical protein
LIRLSQPLVVDPQVVEKVVKRASRIQGELTSAGESVVSNRNSLKVVNEYSVQISINLNSHSERANRWTGY